MSGTLRIATAIFVALARSQDGASAQTSASDWIDAFPSVTAVAQASFEELRVTAARKNFDNTHDDDAIAINLAGTFVTLREIIYLKRRKEPLMSPSRRAKLDRLVAAYQEAELTIGRGAAGRRGYITARPPAGLDCKDLECYDRWFLMHLNASTSRAEYRGRILKRLFPCGSLATELDELRQSSTRTGALPYLPSPSVTGKLESGTVAGQAPSGCGSYGGDANKNGFCDAWEAGFASSRSKQSDESQGCGTLTLVAATTPDARGIEIEYTVDSLWSPRDVQFKVYRSARTAPDNSPPVAEKTLRIPVAAADQPQKIRIVESVDLAPDPGKPYVIVASEQSGHESSAWFQKHLVGVLVHGYTFRKWYEAVNAVNARAGVAMADWLFSGDDVEPWQAILESTLEAACYSPATFAFAWRHSSVKALRGELTMQARERLWPNILGTAAQLVQAHKGDVVDLHLIGHSRGAVMVSQALVAMAEHRPNPILNGGYVIVTLLDPHPANNRFGVQEDYVPTQLLSNLSFSSYKGFQDSTQDPTIILPAGAGIREVYVLFQKNTAEQLAANPPATGNAWDSAVDAAAAFWLWGWNGDNAQIVNRSGVPIRSQKLVKFPDGELLTHGGVVRYFTDHYTPLDPLQRMSPDRGNCPSVHRIR